MRTIAILAAVSGFLCVAIGAFGAHALGDERARALVETGVRYQMFHTLALPAAAAMVRFGARAARFAVPAFVAGMLVFCGSLYAMALGAPRFLGAVTPIGGVLFLAGWAILVWAAQALPQGSGKERP